MSGARVISAIGLAVVIATGAAVAEDVNALTGRGATDAPGAVLEPVHGGPGTAEGPSYLLQPTRDGGFVYNGTQFGARIAPDGGVSFQTHHFQLSPDGPNPSSVGIDAVTPQVPYSGSIPMAIESRPGVRFDLTAEYMRMLGQDPARAEKANFLAATFDLRMKMGAQARRVQRQAALSELPARLSELWRDPRLTRTERVHLLQAMWNDLAEGPDAEPAREVIRAFAQQNLSREEAAAFRSP